MIWVSVIVRRRDEISCLKRDSIVGGPAVMGKVPDWIHGCTSSRNGPIYNQQANSAKKLRGKGVLGLGTNMRTSTDSSLATRHISSKPSHPPVSVPQGPLATTILTPLVINSELLTSGHGSR